MQVAVTERGISGVLISIQVFQLVYCTPDPHIQSQFQAFSIGDTARRHLVHEAFFEHVLQLDLAHIFVGKHLNMTESAKYTSQREENVHIRVVKATRVIKLS